MTGLILLCAAALAVDLTEEVATPTIGARLIHLGSFRDRAKDITLPDADGALVLSVSPGSPAFVAGLKPFDLIQEINNTDIDSLESFVAGFKSLRSGEICDVAVLRTFDQKTWNTQCRGTLCPALTGQVAAAAMKLEVDKVEGVTWVTHREGPKNRSGSGELNSYFAVADGKAKLLRLVCSVRSRLIPTEIVFRAGEHKKTLDLKPFEAKFELGEYAWIDRHVDAELWPTFDALITNDGGIVRYEASGKVIDVNVNFAEIDRLRATRRAYLWLRGETPDGKIIDVDRKEVPIQAEDNRLERVEEKPQEDGKPTAREVKAEKEKSAASKLKLAKQLIDKGKKAEGVKRLKALTEELPNTEAGKEAEKLLEELGG